MRARLVTAAILLALLLTNAFALDAELRKQAKDPEVSERCAAARALGKEGSVEAARVLLGLISDRAAAVRDAAVIACGDLKEPGAVKVIAAAARSNDELDRRNGAEALGRTKNDAALSVLEALAHRDASAQVRADALDALGRFHGNATAPGIATAAATDRDPFVRAAAVDAAGRAGGPDGVEVVRAGLVDAHEGVRCVARAQLLRIARAEALAGLAVAAKDESWRVRAQCVDDASALRDAAAIDVLVRLVGDGVLRVASAAHRALQRISGKELGRDPDIWAAWWSVNRAAWSTPKADAAKHGLLAVRSG